MNIRTRNNHNNESLSVSRSQNMIREKQASIANRSSVERQSYQFSRNTYGNTMQSQASSTSQVQPRNGAKTLAAKLD